MESYTKYENMKSWLWQSQICTESLTIGRTEFKNAESGKGKLLTPPPHTIRLRNDAMARQAPRAGPQGAVHEDYRAVAG